MIFPSFGIVSRTLALACAAIGFAAASPAQAEQFSYPYFEEQVPLELDPDTIVLMTYNQAPQNGAALAPAARKQQLLAAVADFGIEADQVRAHARRGTFLAEAPVAAAAGAGDIRAVVDAMARERVADFVSPRFFDPRGEPMWIRNGLTVAFVEGVTQQQAEQIVDQVIESELAQADFSRMAGVHRFETSSRNGFEVLKAANVLSSHPLVRFAEPDMILTSRSTVEPNDEFFADLWGIKNTGQEGGNLQADMDGDLAWDTTNGSPSIIVLILDDGIEQDHPDINQNPGKDFTGSGTEGGPDSFCDSHGTSVAGCVAAVMDNFIGVVGIAPNCKVISGKFNVSNCNGSGTFSPAALVNAIEWGLEQGARVSNNSNTLGQSAVITSKYASSRDEGMLHFASTGNDGQGSINYPASLSSVNAIGAINRFGNKTGFSNWGEGIDFAAPGHEILTTDLQGSIGISGSDWAVVSGTSYSSPYAAGVAALILAVDPSLTPEAVEEIMQVTAKDFESSGYDLLVGHGVPDADDAVELALGDLAPPQNFALLSPPDGADDVPADVIFGWLQSSNALQYQLVLSTQPDLSDPLIDVIVPTSGSNVVSFQPAQPLPEGLTWWWQVAAGNVVGQVFSPVWTFTTETGCLGDVTGDNLVNSQDLNTLLAVFGQVSSIADLNADGMVDSQDLNLLLSNFGSECS